MKNMYPFLSLLLVFLTLLSCKSDTKEATGDTSEEATQVVSEKPVVKERKIPTEAEKKQAKSVLSKLMVTPELKAFTSFLVSAQLTDLVMKDEGPYTILAPTNEAFDNLEESVRNGFLRRENKEQLTAVLRNHIVSGSLDSATLFQNSKNGNYTLTTLNGETLTVTKEGNDIVITAASGVKAKIGKSDIQGSNGVVHIVDAVFVSN
ncbi:fasciclin domain-containing protein [Altibacter lentus]|uniref:fasciclin domain-containing protein n=1 Tax=Altibacter lentus TaxID=1223410 RepID=UPI000558E823|nr:fasciclin domain-containing protein [Altibacter lentus]